MSALANKRNLAAAIHDLIKRSSPDGVDIAVTIDALSYVISDAVGMPMRLVLMHEADASAYVKDLKGPAQ